MARSIMISVVIMALLPLYSNGQVPGDMNCSGSFNGLDVTFLAGHLFHFIGVHPDHLWIPPFAPGKMGI
jgi:hypothetical protein